MHKLPQPVKLWYLSSFFRQEKPQAGRFRQFWQVGAEAIGSDDPAVDAELIVLLRTLLDELERPRRAAAAREPRRSRPRAPRTARSSPRTCARTRTASRPRSSRASTSTRCARSTPSDPGTRAVMRERAAAARPPRRRGPRALRRGLRAARRGRRRLRARPDARARPRLLHAHAVRVHLRRARRPDRGVGGGGRYDGLIELLGGPPTPGMRLGGRGRADAAGRRASARVRAGALRPVRRRDADRARRGVRAGGRGARAPGSPPAWSSAGARCKGQLKQADRIGARYVAILGRRRRPMRCSDMDAGEQEDVEPAARSSRACSQGRHLRMMQRAPRANPYRDAWCGDLDAERAGTRGPRRRLGAPPPRPRRADLHRPARPLGDRAARLPPRDLAATRSPLAEQLRSEHVDLAPRARSSARAPGNVNPNLADRRDRDRTCARCERLAELDDAAVPDRRGHAGRRDAAPAPPHARPAPRAHARRDGAAPRGRRGRCARSSTSATSSRSRRRS